MNQQPAVVYVEDDPLNRKMMGLLLKGRMKLPHVTIFEDSRDVIARLEKLDPKPDIILLDIHVAPYNGFEMLAMLRQTEWAASTPIVALTASVMNDEVQQLRNVGFNGCLAKPIDLETFPDMLHRLLAGEAIWSIINQ